jgi:hypothetical protein
MLTMDNYQSERRASSMEIMSQARRYTYLFGVLKNQQADPFCRSCNSFINTLTAVKENLAKFETQHDGEIKKFSWELSRLFADARNGIAVMNQPENPVGQKKAGNCKLPEGVCFTKSSLAILQKV